MYYWGMEKFKLSELLHGRKATPIDPAILAKLNAGEKVTLLDVEHKAIVHYEKMPNGNIDIYTEHMHDLKPLAQNYVVGVDPASPAGINVFPTFSANRGGIQYKPNDWSRQNLDDWANPMSSTTGRYRKWQLSWGRGNGKNRAIANWTKAQETLAKAAEEASEGLKKLAEANAEIAKLEYDAHMEAEEAVTDEKVKAFAEQYYLPEDYARDILITAYVDSLLEEGKPDDSTESTAEGDALPDDYTKS